MRKARCLVRSVLGPPARAFLRMVPPRVAEKLPRWIQRTRAARVWSNSELQWEIGGDSHWTELARIQEMINRRFSGDPLVDPYLHFVRTYLNGRLPLQRALTLGCGMGELERGLVQYGFCMKHDAIDVAPGAIEEARRRAREAGLDHIEYRVADLNRPGIPVAAYDVVFGVYSVHHIEELEQLFSAVARSLKPQGYFFLNEFVGPSRFQWTERQLEVANALLTILPEDFRRDSRTGKVKQAVIRPTVAEMVWADPSEAIRSSDILSALSEHFETVEIRPYGGTVLQPLLHGIAGCFQGDDGIANRLLEILVDAEAALMDAGDLPSDFVIVVATPRQ